MFQDSLFRNHYQRSMQYVPSLVPTTRLTHPLHPLPSRTLSLFLSWFISPSHFLQLLSPLLLPVSSVLLLMLHKWDHMIVDSLCLSYFTQYNLLQSLFNISEPLLLPLYPHLFYPPSPWHNISEIETCLPLIFMEMVLSVQQKKTLCFDFLFFWLDLM